MEIMDVKSVRGNVSLGDIEFIMHGHKPHNYQHYREQDAPITMVSVSLESLYTNKPFLPRVGSGLGFSHRHEKNTQGMVVVQNLVKPL